MSNQPATEPADLENDQDENQNDSLRDIIEASFDAAEATSDDDTTSIDESQDTAGDDDEVITQDDLTSGDEAAAAAEAEKTDLTSDLEASDEDEKQEIEDKIDYPEHWDKTTKESFDGLPKDQQQFVVGRIKDMEADYTRKRQADTDFRRSYEPIDQIMTPFKQDLQKAGINESELIRRWAVAENHLNTNPHQAIKQIATHYGVDLTQLAYGGEHFETTPQTDPVVQNLQTQVGELQNTISTQQSNDNLKTIESFAAETDESGTKKHPYFDDVVEDVMLELQIDRQQGKQSDLGTLYERACYRNTSVRQKLIEAQQKAATDESKAAAKEAADKANANARLKAEQAKKAGKSVVGDPGGAAQAKKQHESIRSAVEDAWSANN